jgi:hypothetical protein
MTENTSRDTAPAVPDDPEALAEDIKQTREQLGEAVEALAAKTDVKARAREKAAQVSSRVRVTTARAAHQARDRGGQLAAKTSTARQALPVVAAGSVTGSAVAVLTYLAARRWVQR